MRSLTFRSAQEQDLGKIIDLAVLSFGKYLPLLEQEHAENMSKNLRDPERMMQLMQTSQGLLCFSDEQLVGMVFYISSGNPWDVFLPEWSYIRFLGVDPGFEGKGIARKLTMQCIDLAKNSGEKVLALHTSEVMGNARKLYESIGFTIFKEIDARLGQRYFLYTLNL